MDCVNGKIKIVEKYLSCFFTKFIAWEIIRFFMRYTSVLITASFLSEQRVYVEGCGSPNMGFCRNSFFWSFEDF